MNHTWSFFTEDISVEQAFDDFYVFIDDLLNRFFPLRKISIKRKDPSYMTPKLKYLLRRRNTVLRVRLRMLLPVGSMTVLLKQMLPHSRVLNVAVGCSGL